MKKKLPSIVPSRPILPKGLERNPEQIFDYLHRFDRTTRDEWRRLVERVGELEKAFEYMGDPTGFENQTDSTISFTDGTRTFEIAPVGEYYAILFNGDLIQKTATETCVITDTEGLWVIYFDTDGAIQCTQSFDIATLVESAVLIAYVYWDATNNEAIYFGDERHGLMPHQVHALWHLTHGTNYISGCGLGDFVIDDTGADDEDAEFSVAAGVIVDEDIFFSHSALGSTAAKPKFYKDGASGDWRRLATGSAGVLNTGAGRAEYNEWTGATWQLTEVSNNSFLLAHVVATNDRDQPFIVVIGEAEYGNISAAREGANVEANAIITAGLPFQEFVFIGSIIYQTSDAYANTWASRTRTTDEGDDYVDWRSQPLTPGSPPGDHQNLTGRDTDNAHPATAVAADTTNFDGYLSGTETDVQLALDALDDHTHVEADVTDLDHTDADAIHDNVAGEISALSHVLPDFDDNFIIEDDSDSDNKKRVTYKRVMRFDAVGRGNFTYVSNDTGSALAKGDLCYISGDSSGVPQVTLADADAESTCSKQLVLIYDTTIANGADGWALLVGVLDGFSGLTAGAIQYASTTAGDLTETAPSGSGDIVRIVGTAISTTEVLFNPDATFVEVA